MASEVSGVGKGYFTEKGELKTEKQIAKEESPQKPAPRDTAAVSNETTVSTAVNSVRSRFLEKANAVLNVVNEDTKNIKDASAAVSEQLTAARELKSALKDGDKKEIKAAREKLDQATEKRNEVAEQIQQDNARLVTERGKSLSVGNQQLGVVKVEAVRFEKVVPQEHIDAKDLQNLIESLKKDRSDLSQQRQEHIDVRNEVKSVVQSTDSQLSRVEEGTIRSIQEAESSAQDLANRITSNGAQALSATRISESIVRQLLQ
ncbi:MAG: hypothetical protein J0M12_10035 [Deltaproteobacteria bacterium]|nr:hypothetical protein [Deltaproteobacteria bacterium]